MDALRLIERYDNPDVLMYLDPPYVRSTRRSGRLYNHEMTDDDHRRMLELITKSRAQIILSGYASNMYDNALQGWHKDITQSQTTSTAMATGRSGKNFEPPAEQITFFKAIKEAKP